MPAATVLVRTRNAVTTVQAALHSVRAQTVAAELLLVDGGSTDGTLDVAADLVDRVVHVPPERFSHGGALNAGAEAARAPVHVALSAHCRLPHTRWLERALEDLGRLGVVAASGADVDGRGRPLDQPLVADHQHLSEHPFWGFSNHASAWKRQAWAAEPFDEALPACEDREWSWRVTRAGGSIVIDPRLVVSVAHRRGAGVRRYLERLRRELGVYRALGLLPAYPVRQAARDWLGLPGERSGPVLSSRRGGRTRLVEVTAQWQAARLPRGTGPTTAGRGDRRGS